MSAGYGSRKPNAPKGKRKWVSIVGRSEALKKRRENHTIKGLKLPVGIKSRAQAKNRDNSLGGVHNHPLTCSFTKNPRRKKERGCKGIVGSA